MAAAFEPSAFSTAFEAVVVAPVDHFMSTFSQLVLATDRAAQSLLGGELVTYAPAVGVPVQVTGIFDANYVLVKGSASAGVEALGPAVFFRLEDLPVDLEDDEPILTIGGLDYKVTERRPDDMGGIVLVLRRAS